MTETELDMILTFRWPRVVRRVMGAGDDPKLMGFVRSISRNGRRKTWHPSPKQEAWMHAILSDFDAEHEPDLEVIERE
ncbi:hypothetical protein [Chachezhania sediminis]|uniref:hypothetical protein n=1 Tax=Chachezhania sediminis TaxID=2599291 RepID=UPI00131E916C|nr:hypothetical protein [Chachezhania sediminis]